MFFTWSLLLISLLKLLPLLFGIQEVLACSKIKNVYYQVMS